MKNTKFLTPLSYTSRELVKNERKSGFRSEDLSENPQRLNRDNLKHYLSTNQIKTPLHSIKKKFELTESNLFLPTSPRILQKLAVSTENKQCTKEKCIDNIIAIRLANKNVLKAFSKPYRSEEKKSNDLFIVVPEELKVLDQKNETERTSALKLLEWFETMQKTELEGLFFNKFLNLDPVSQENLIKTADSILSIGLQKLIEQVQIHCNENAIMISNLFNVYKAY